MTKKWYKSKGMWLGIVVTLGSALDLVEGFIVEGDMSERAMILLAVGVAQIVVRAVTKDAVTI